MVHPEGFASPLASPELHLSKQVLKSRFVSGLPLAVLTPTFLAKMFEYLQCLYKTIKRFNKMGFASAAKENYFCYADPAA